MNNTDYYAKYMKYKNKYFVLKQNSYGYSQNSNLSQGKLEHTNKNKYLELRSEQSSYLDGGGKLTPIQFTKKVYDTIIERLNIISKKDKLEGEIKLSAIKRDKITNAYTTYTFYWTLVRDNLLQLKDKIVDYIELGGNIADLKPKRGLSGEEIIYGLRKELCEQISKCIINPETILVEKDGITPSINGKMSMGNGLFRYAQIKDLLTDLLQVHKLLTTGHFSRNIDIPPECNSNSCNNIISNVLIPGATIGTAANLNTYLDKRNAPPRPDAAKPTIAPPIPDTPKPTFAPPIPDTPKPTIAPPRPDAAGPIGPGYENVAPAGKPGISTPDTYSRLGPRPMPTLPSNLGSYEDPDAVPLTNPRSGSNYPEYGDGSTSSIIYSTANDPGLLPGPPYFDIKPKPTNNKYMIGGAPATTESAEDTLVRLLLNLNLILKNILIDQKTPSAEKNHQRRCDYYGLLYNAINDINGVATRWFQNNKDKDLSKLKELLNHYLGKLTPNITLDALIENLITVNKNICTLMSTNNNPTEANKLNKTFIDVKPTTPLLILPDADYTNKPPDQQALDPTLCKEYKKITFGLLQDLVVSTYNLFMPDKKIAKCY